VFVNVLRHRDRLEDASPSSLLYRIATNVCLNHIRTARRHPEAPGEDLVEQVSGCADPERAALSRSLLSRLFPPDLEPLALMAVLRYLDGMTFAEVAREVGLSASCVRKRLLLLRESLSGLEA
jgi:RNA polymerase sigma-70 factor (ECF subfamily)